MDYHNLCNFLDPLPGTLHLLRLNLKCCIESMYQNFCIPDTLESLQHQASFEHYWENDVRKNDDNNEDSNPKF